MIRASRGLWRQNKKAQRASLGASLFHFRMASVFSMLLHAQAVLTDPIHANLHLVNLTGEGSPQRIGVNPQTSRIQTIHLSAAFAVKMGMGPVKIIGRQAEIGGPAPRAEPLKDPMLDEQIKNAVYGHAIDRTAPFQGLEDVCGRQGIFVVAHNFQHAKAVFAGLQIRGIQQLHIVTLITHSAFQP